MIRKAFIRFDRTKGRNTKRIDFINLTGPKIEMIDEEMDPFIKSRFGNLIFVTKLSNRTAFDKIFKQNNKDES